MMIPIYNNEPSDWKDLQEKVGKIFSDLGFNTEIEKDIETVRGFVNVDVFSTKDDNAVKETHICECKHWKSSIPKSVVHSFRTVIADHGANSGYIISRNGFQSGAYIAARNSNVYLYSFDQFQEIFRERWLNAVVDDLEIIGYPLRKLTDPIESFYDKNLLKLDESIQQKIRELMDKYHVLSLSTFRLHYKNVMTGLLEIDWIDETIINNSKRFLDEIKIDCLMDYFDYLKETCINGLNEFDELYGEKVRKE